MIKIEGETGIKLKRVLDWCRKCFYLSEGEAKRYFFEAVFELLTINELAVKLEELLLKFT